MNNLFSFTWMIPVVLVGLIFIGRFSWASRIMRRRRRSYYRVAAKAKRPMVTFMVRAR
ncbi:MAG TPA: hypothetical protein VKM56_14615 [Verrucomicrobiae bacterium]|nr:hypothetical protein [Verrucomicrobiae bacterium]